MNTKLMAGVFLFLAIACRQRPTPTDNDDSTKVQKPITRIDTVTTLTDQTDSMLVFKSPNGKFYQVTIDSDTTAFTATRLDCTKDGFFGIKRKAAKTSIASGSASPYTVMSNFLKTLKPDSIMNKHPLINSSATNNRVAEEKRNVKLTRVFMYAISREDDNDYHLILGDAKGNYLTAECSGLPEQRSASYSRLEKPRNVLKSYFGSVCMANYRKFNPAVEVEVTGSLFFDTDHDAGTVGPLGMRPKTAWEIHPVTNIVFK